MLSLLRKHLQASSAKGVLLAAVEALADVIAVPMDADIAQLDLSGARPVVWLDPRCAVEDLHHVMLEVIAAIVLGPEAARSAYPAPKLASVG